MFPLKTSTFAFHISTALRRCAAATADLRHGQRLHAQLLSRGLILDATLQADLLLMYARCSHSDLDHHARNLFDEMPRDARTMHSWNIMITSYVQSSLYSSAIALLSPFLHLGLFPDHFTLPSLFKACAATGDVLLGMELHAWSILLGLEDHLVVRSSMLDMYAKCGRLDDAHQLFDMMPNRDVVIWNSMISGFTRGGRSMEALGIFRRLQFEGVEVDSRAVPSVLTACGREGDLMRGKEVHAKAIRCFSCDSDVAIGNSLIDMYAKCGCLHHSSRVFASMRRRSLVTWSALISCHGVHGEGKAALGIYRDMIALGFKPNCITFTSVLTSCSHSGLVDEGREVFESMYSIYGVAPGIEHYACMVDLVGRSGAIDEAVKLIDEMPLEPAASVWGALLASCAMHKNIEIGEAAARKLFELEPGNPSNYVALLGIYDAARLREGVLKIRSRMRELGMAKTPGCSWILLKNRHHAFYQGDSSHPYAQGMHEILVQLHLHMIEETVKRVYLAIWSLPYQRSS